MTEFTRTRIAAMIIQDDKLLLLKGIGYDELWTPGGKIESGEDDITCLQRELAEELGVKLQSATFFKEYNGTSYYNKEVSLIQRVYVVTITGSPKANAEIESMVWFSKDDFNSKKYLMITITQDEIIPDLIKAGVW